MKKQIDKKKLKKEILYNLLIILGCLVLALANSLFLVPFDIVKGGMTSIAMIINHYIEAATGATVTDIFVWGFNAILWVIGLIFLGKDFAMKTLVGTICYPLFLTLFTRIDLASLVGITNFYNNGLSEGTQDFGKLIIFGVMGGILSGLGGALAFTGKGSTGGSDVIVFIIAKYTDIKQDVAALLVDSCIIITGLCVYQNWGKAFVGIFAALASSLTVKQVYMKTVSNYVVDIVTDQSELIQKYVSNEFKKTCTISDVKGGYSGEGKTMVHCLLTYHETKKIKDVIGALDEKAFVSVYECSDVIGGAFSSVYSNPKERERIKKTYGIEPKDED